MTSSSNTFPFGIADVVELLGLTVRRRLPSSLYLNCPFCGDLRGRLNVNTDKNVWRCNRCGAAGGMLALYARYNCTGNADAYREICEALGRYTPRPRVNDCIGVKPEQNARAAPQEIYERKFYDDVILVAINRQPDKAYTIDNVETLLPEGEYVDFLGGMLNGENISVYASTGINTTASITLDGGEVGIWQYDAAANAPEIGNVVSTMGRAGNRVYIYGDGLDGNISVKFGETEATVESNTANEIVTYVPDNAVAGYNDITVTKGDAVSNSFTYNVLSGDQNQVIFHVKAETSYGENIYIVGNVPELGSWDPDKCTEALLNPNYPEWFLPVSVPAGTEIQFKFIKKDANGTVTWESGDNRVITSSSLSAGTVDTEVYTWRN